MEVSRAVVFSHTFNKLFFCGALALAPLCAPSAQTRLSPPEHNPSTSLAAILSVLEQTAIIIPGKGFNSIGLGDPISTLVRKWGKPQRIDGDRVLIYQLDPNTIIQFSGEENIEHIVIHGLPGSLARTNNAVIFGMSLIEARSQFNAATSKASETLLRYDQLGIELGFTARVLARIEVFIPDN